MVNVYAIHALTGEPQPLEDPLFHQFFSQFIDPRQGGSGEPPQMSLGSGLVVSAQGLILTNRHLLHLSGDIMIETQAGLTAPARVIALSADSDLALLQAQTRGALVPASMGESEDLTVGQTVLAVGNPFGLSHTATVGIISDFHRTLAEIGYSDMIVTSAQINPGNSGGPLIDEVGQVIGINTAFYAQGPGLNFAVPIDQALRFIAAHASASAGGRGHTHLSGLPPAR